MDKNQPHLDDSYGQLLRRLRKDLQLDATTDLLPGSILAALTDQNDQAQFLQLSAPGRQVINGAQAAGVFPGGSPQTTALVVTHGLINPARAPALAFSESTNVNVGYAVIATSPTTITVQGQTLDGTSPGAGTTIPFFWVVIG